MIPDSLDIFGDRLDARGAEDVFGALTHAAQDVVEDLRVVGVDDLVLVNGSTGTRRFLILERPQRLP